MKIEDSLKNNIIVVIVLIIRPSLNVIVKRLHYLYKIM